MINIRKIDIGLGYTFGSWTSQALTNSLGGFDSETASTWGYLYWDEENIGTGYDGEVRIDILNASDDAVIVGDIAKNTDGTPTDISSAGTNNIKVRVKLYGLTSPTPKVYNLWVKHKNWLGKQMITNAGKNVLLNRIYASVPSTNPINRSKIGTGQNEDFTENTLFLINEESTALSHNNVTYDEINKTVKTELYLDETDTQVANGTVMNAISYENSDASPAFCGGVRFMDVTKSASYRYYIRSEFKIVEEPAATYILTDKGKNVFLERTFNASPVYNAVNRFVTGENTALSASMSGLTTRHYGPATFTYSLLDTAVNKVTLRATLDKDSGNGFYYDTIGHENSDSTPAFIYAGNTSIPVLKSENYVFLFTASYMILSPSEAWLG